MSDWVGTDWTRLRDEEEQKDAAHPMPPTQPITRGEGDWVGSRDDWRVVPPLNMAGLPSPLGRGNDETWATLAKQPLFNELMWMFHAAQWSNVDMTLGDPEQYETILYDTLMGIADETGIPGAVIRQYAMGAQSDWLRLNAQELPPHLQRTFGENALMDFIGLLDPIVGLELFATTFHANLAHEQAQSGRPRERGFVRLGPPPVEHEGGSGRLTLDAEGVREARWLPPPGGGQHPLAVMPSGEQRDFAYAPAGDPITAAAEMGRAFWNTWQQLGMDEHMFKGREVDPTASWLSRAAQAIVPKGNTESFWYVFTPTLNFQNLRLYGESWSSARAHAHETGSGVNYVDGRDLLELSGLDEHWGLETELQKELTGSLLQFMHNPLTYADFLFAGSRIVSGVARASGHEGALRHAANFERMARDTYRMLTPAGVAHRGREIAGGLSFGISDAVFGAMGRAFNNFLDLPMPQIFVPKNMRAPYGTAGWPIEGAAAGGRVPALPPPRVRDVFLQGGVGAWVPRKETMPPGMTGGDDVGRISWAEEAMGHSSVLRDIGTRGMIAVGEALTRGLPSRPVNLRYPWRRTAVPGLNAVDEAYHGYVRALGATVSDWVDTAGVLASPAGDEHLMERLISLSNLYNMPLPETMSRFTGALKASRNVVLQTGYELSGYPHFISAMNRAAKAFHVDQNDLRRAYELFHSGGVDLQALEYRGGIRSVRPGPAGPTGATLGTPASATNVTTLINRMQQDPNFVAQIDSLIESALVQAGVRSPMDPATGVRVGGGLEAFSGKRFLEGLRDGYLRREFEAITDPTRAYNRVAWARDGHQVPIPEVGIMRSVDIGDTAALFGQQYGPEAERVVREYLGVMTPPPARGSTAWHAAGGVGRTPPATPSSGAAGTAFGLLGATAGMDDAPRLTGAVPTGLAATGRAPVGLTFEIGDLAALLSNRLHRTVTPDELTKLFYGHDPNYVMLQETMEGLSPLLHEGATARTAGGAPWSMAPSTYAPRQDIDAERIAQLLVSRDPLFQTGRTAYLGARHITGQEFLRLAFNDLGDLGLILPEQAVPLNAVHGAGESIVFPFQNAEGLKYVLLPNNARTWGPLAGKAIPEDVARTMLYTISTIDQQFDGYARALSMWRQMLISPLSTSMRNVFSNFLLIHQAGGNLTDLIQALPRADALRTQFINSGLLPDDLRGYEHLFGRIVDSTQTQAAMHGMTDLLQEVSEGRVGFETVFNRAEDFVQWATTDPVAGWATLGGTGSLKVFRYGEELTRVSAFLTTYDSLIRGGMDQAEAVHRAVHFAVNSAYNYGALPMGPGLLKRTGLSAFPQFAYFTGGRTARAMYENPLSLTRPELVRKGLNLTVSDGDRGELERLTANMPFYMRQGAALFPMVTPDGERWVMDMQYWFPQGANMADVFADPFTFPFLTPVIDSVGAWTSGTGRGPFSARFGTQVFSPGDDALTKAAATGAYVASQYLFPGVTRMVSRGFDAYRYHGDPDFYDDWAESKGRYMNSSVLQVGLRQLGINTRRVASEPGSIGEFGNIRDIRGRYSRMITDVQNRLKGTPDSQPEEQARLVARMEYLFRLMDEEITALERLLRSSQRESER